MTRLAGRARRRRITSAAQAGPPRGEPNQEAMNDRDATKKLTSAVTVTREDIARAKTYVLASSQARPMSLPIAGSP